MCTHWRRANDHASVCPSLRVASHTGGLLLSTWPRPLATQAHSALSEHSGGQLSALSVAHQRQYRRDELLLLHTASG